MTVPVCISNTAPFLSLDGHVAFYQYAPNLLQYTMYAMSQNSIT